MGSRRQRFEGRILGVGTSAGPRIVVGIWERSPFGPFADVMLEEAVAPPAPGGADADPRPRRLLIAPPQVADFVATTYRFEDVQVAPVHVTELPRSDTGALLRIGAGPLELEVEVGSRSALGWALRAVPRRIACAPAWARAVSPIAGLVMSGVRTWGSAGNGRYEAYGAWDHHRVLRLGGTWEGRDLGALAPLDPPVRFGFGSAPHTPSLTSIVTTVIG